MMSEMWTKYGWIAWTSKFTPRVKVPSADAVSIGSRCDTIRMVRVPKLL